MGERLERARAAQEERLLDFEERLQVVVAQVMERWLAEVRRKVLGNATVTAATPPPDMGGFDAADLVWRLALRDLLRPLVGDLFGEAFLAIARTNLVSAQQYRAIVIEDVESRLKIFPAEQFEEIRMEIAEAISEGESINQVRDRVGAFLNFDSTPGAKGEQAETRRLQGRIDEVERILDDPDNGLDDAEIRALRSQRGQLYEALYEAKGGWEWKARRIARTEAALALNAGTYYAALASAEANEETLWKHWIATADVRTRATHVVADGQVRLLSDHFTVGGTPLLYPADPAGPGHETINCRCSLLIFDALDLEDEGIDPDNLPDSNPQPRAATTPPADEDAGPVKVQDAQKIPGKKIPPAKKRPTKKAGATTASASLNDEQGDPVAGQLPDGWRGILAPFDVRSGDGRIIATPATLRVRQAPRSLLWQPTLEMGHGGAVVAGRIDRVWIEDGNLMGEGPFDLKSADGAEAARQLGEGFTNGISVDLDDMIMSEHWFDAQGNEIPLNEDTDWDALWESGAQPVMVADEWRLMTATMVPQPAFDQARIQPLYGYTPHDEADLPVESGPRISTDEAGDPGLVASLIGDASLPVAAADYGWDPEQAKINIFQKYIDQEDGLLEIDEVSRAFLWVDPDVGVEAMDAYSLGFADLVDGALTIIPAAVEALPALVDALELEEGDRTALQDAVCGLYASVSAALEEFPACPYAEADDADEGADVPAEDVPMMEASGTPIVLTAAGAVMVFADGDVLPATAFADPELAGPTPLTVTDEGHIYGHVATWGTCHVGFPDVCVTPPRSETQYALFHVGEVLTDAGPLPVGRITLGTGHADARMGARPAAEHYDNTGSCVAVCQAGEDAHGIWVAGLLTGNVTDAQIAELRRSPLSGDWRRVNGNLEMVAALAVNVPGFPIPRVLAASGAAGQQLSLCAAGAVPQPRPARPAREGVGGGAQLDYALLARAIVREQNLATQRFTKIQRLTKRIGADPASRANALAERIGVGRG